jgi:hypothetical protein
MVSSGRGNFNCPLGRMKTSFRLAQRRWYPALFAVTMAGIGILVIGYAPPARTFELLIAGMGVVAGLVYFLYTQQLQETRLFSDLFRQFNERYDHLNEALNVIAWRDEDVMLTASDKQVLFDYFNLCAEEYLYYKTGYIDEEVWQSWTRGMATFVCSQDVRRLWEAEISSGSYYGFTLDVLGKANSKGLIA